MHGGILPTAGEVLDDALYVLRGGHNQVERLEVGLGFAVARNGLDHCAP